MKKVLYFSHYPMKSEMHEGKIITLRQTRQARRRDVDLRQVELLKLWALRLHPDSDFRLFVCFAARVCSQTKETVIAFP